MRLEIFTIIGSSELFTYDKKNQLTCKEDSDGFKTEYGFDPAGNLNKVKYEDSKEVKYRYSPLSKLMEVEEELGKTLIKRDKLGREISITDHRDKTIEYEYNRFGDIDKIIYPDGSEVRYTFDKKGIMTKVKSADNEVKYSYDKTGYIKEKSYSNGITVGYKSTPGGKLLELTHKKEDSVINKFNYTYDSMCNRLSIDKFRDGDSEITGLYEYSYDELNRLTDVSKDGKKISSFGYDNFGNRIREERSGKKNTLSYNSLNQLIKNESGNNTKSYIYDKRGNLTKVLMNNELMNSYEWNAMNRLKEAANHKGEKANYSYNGIGHRVSKEITKDNLNPAERIEYIIDQTREYDNLLQYETTDGKNMSFMWFDEPLMMIEDDAAFGLIHDELSSTIGLTDSKGNIVESYDYDDFGMPKAAISEDRINITQPFGFTGYMYDDISDTYFAQAREYAPTDGRFVSKDILKGFADRPQTLNEYSYCFNNPKKYVDKDGKVPKRFHNSAKKYMPKYDITEIEVKASLPIKNVKINADFIISYDSNTGLIKVTSNNQKLSYEDRSNMNTKKKITSLIPSITIRQIKNEKARKQITDGDFSSIGGAYKYVKSVTYAKNNELLQSELSFGTFGFDIVFELEDKYKLGKSIH